jgi:hypothetical protein
VTGRKVVIAACLRSPMDFIRRELSSSFHIPFHSHVFCNLSAFVGREARDCALPTLFSLCRARRGRVALRSYRAPQPGGSGGSIDGCQSTLLDRTTTLWRDAMMRSMTWL